MDWDSLNTLARELGARMADASLRALLLAILALLPVAFLRRSSTAQHTLWTLVLVGMIALPFLRPVVPATHIPLPRVWAPHATRTEPLLLRANLSGIAAPISPAKAATPVVLLWPLFGMAAYLAGVALFGARLLGGVLLTRRVLRITRMIHSELWEYFDLIAKANADVSLEESDSVRVPLTTGSKRMRVILPANWREWPAANIRAVLAHELEHARRRDPLIALLAAVNKCVFWFHPLAWWLERRLAVLAEHAADNAGLAVSFDAASYARLLLDHAARLENRCSRLRWHSAAMSGPVVAQRIRRVLDLGTTERIKPLGRIGRALVLSTGAALIWISTAVDIRSVAAAQANRVANVQDGSQFGFLADGGSPDSTTIEQATAMEQELERLMRTPKTGG